jgi:phosphoribosyl 1,2-cyclic phosphodiesterase
MRVKFWGVRGSIACPGKNTAEFGGNTSCLEIEDDEGNLFVFDAGTGIRMLGNDLAKRKVNNIHLFISHTHWDHIQGFPFFTPAYIPGNKVHIYGPIHFEKTLNKIMNLQMDYAYFPVSMQQLNAKIDYTDLKETKIEIGKTVIITKYSNHPVTALCYKVICNGKTVVYTGDFEPYFNVLKSNAQPDPSGQEDFAANVAGEGTDEDIDSIVEERNEHHRKFCEADILIHDAQYTEEEYKKTQGWGHSPMEWVIRNAKSVGVKRLVLSHHDPARTDAALFELEKKFRAENPGFDVFFSKEGMELKL